MSTHRILRWQIVAIIVFCIHNPISSSAQVVSTLANFDVDPAGPGYMSLIEGLDGNLYGTTTAFGGSAFEVTSVGVITTLASFGSPNGTVPNAGLVQVPLGDFFGTASQGGTHGYGTVFRVTPKGLLTTLYDFCTQTNCTDGEYPYSTLVIADDGNFYGTTELGGANGYGTVFQMTTGGKLTTLYSFNFTDGYAPLAGLVQGSNGDLYGTTEGGGAFGGGTVFEISTQGVLTTLYSFCKHRGCADGAYPYAGLTLASDGSFYGTTEAGGTYNLGTVFRISGAGVLTVLHSFDATVTTEGAFPTAGLVLASNGELYGTTSGTINGRYGTIYEMSPAGKFKTIHTFGYTDGATPLGGLMQATNGDLYGTTLRGGEFSSGTIYSISFKP